MLRRFGSPLSSIGHAIHSKNGLSIWNVSNTVLGIGGSSGELEKGLASPEAPYELWCCFPCWGSTGSSKNIELEPRKGSAKTCLLLRLAGWGSGWWCWKFLEVRREPGQEGPSGRVHSDGHPQCLSQPYSLLGSLCPTTQRYPGG